MSGAAGFAAADHPQGHVGTQKFEGVRKLPELSPQPCTCSLPCAVLTLAFAFRLVLSQLLPRVCAGREPAFIHVPTGSARREAAPAGTSDLRDGPEALFAMGAHWAIPTVECPEVAYRQGAADVCAAHGLASAVHEYGDTLAAASIAACARAALASGDAFGYVCDHVNDSAIRLGCGASFRSPHQLAACRLGRCWHARGGNTRLSVRTPCASVLAVSVHRALPACGARRRLFGVRVAHRHMTRHQSSIMFFILIMPMISCFGMCEMMHHHFMRYPFISCAYTRTQ